MTVHARVKNGRLLVDEPTDLPDGTELVLIPAGEEPQAWDLTPQEAAELKERLAQADDRVAGDEVHERLRAGR